MKSKRQLYWSLKALLGNVRQDIRHNSLFPAIAIHIIIEWVKQYNMYVNQTRLKIKLKFWLKF
jgi:hypothetical protein